MTANFKSLEETWIDLALREPEEVRYERHEVGRFYFRYEDGQVHCYVWTVNSWRKYLETKLEQKKPAHKPNKWIQYQLDSMFKGW